jgi:hypothetical protein
MGSVVEVEAEVEVEVEKLSVVFLAATASCRSLVGLNLILSLPLGGTRNQPPPKAP